MIPRFPRPSSFYRVGFFAAVLLVAAPLRAASVALTNATIAELPARVLPAKTPALPGETINY